MTIYLYIKQHSITGLKYFGKTIKQDPFSYNGSGIYWTKHINKHGKQYIKTLEVWGFDNQEWCTEFALKFSQDNNIVESNEWANLMEENGMGASGSVGRKCSEETKEKMRKSNLGKKHKKFSEKTKEKMRKPKSENHIKNFCKRYKNNKHGWFNDGIKEYLLPLNSEKTLYLKRGLISQRKYRKSKEIF